MKPLITGRESHSNKKFDFQNLFAKTLTSRVTLALSNRHLDKFQLLYNDSNTKDSFLKNKSYLSKYHLYPPKNYNGNDELEFDSKKGNTEKLIKSQKAENHFKKNFTKTLSPQKIYSNLISEESQRTNFTAQNQISEPIKESRKKLHKKTMHNERTKTMSKFKLDNHKVIFRMIIRCLNEYFRLLKKKQ